jgi:hypothetical protein
MRLQPASGEAGNRKIACESRLWKKRNALLVQGYRSPQLFSSKE